jgi:hypothetical protein
MKTNPINIAILLVAALPLLGCSYLSSGSKTSSYANPVDELVSLCVDANYPEASKHMLYDGTDPAKKGKPGSYDQDDQQNKDRVAGMCKRFSNLKTQGYTVGAAQPKEQKGETFYQFDVEVKGQPKKQMWFFRKMDSRDVLVDID